ncbi:MAG: response regulator [Treponema sp.]|nr:response regulator [Treponema sp.]
MVAMINEQYVCKNPDFAVVKSCRNGQEAIDFLTGATPAGGATQPALGALGSSVPGAPGAPDTVPASAELSAGNTPDLIIMDVFMPYMNGIETLKKIRELKISSEVIMVTAANDTATLEETMHLGVLDFLIKPFAYERFQVALEKFAAKAQTLRTTPTVIDQSYVDSLISSASATSLSANGAARPGTPASAAAAELPKGIQQKTLGLILGYFKEHSGWLPGDKVAEDVGLSSVTIRHYMSYLVERGDIRADINYSTGGRPSMLYSIKS